MVHLPIHGRDREDLERQPDEREGPPQEAKPGQRPDASPQDQPQQDAEDDRAGDQEHDESLVSRMTTAEAKARQKFPQPGMAAPVGARYADIGGEPSDGQGRIAWARDQA
jgi:hypothetical protein